MSSVANYPHITVDESGAAHIGQTRYKVIHLAAEHYHYGWSAEELLRQHPDLQPAQVYAALTYFHDHHDALVGEMLEQAENVERFRSQQTMSRADLLARREAVE